MAKKNIPQGLKNYTLKRFGLASDEIEKLSAQRTEVCDSCEYKKSEVIPRCSVCGCSLALKTRVEDETCPKGKW